MSTHLEGIDLVRAVIEQVRAKGFAEVFGAWRVSPQLEPKPVAKDVLDRVRLGGDLPLTPCLKEWLAFDGSLFGWVIRQDTIVGQKLGALSEEHFDDLIAQMYSPLERDLSGDCYALPFAHDEALHFVYASTVDAIGELPVMTAEPENARIGIQYPGIDIFLGAHAKLLEKDWRSRVSSRLAEHQKNTLGGKQAIEPFEDDDSEVNVLTALPAGLTKMGPMYMLTGDGPVPDGYQLVQEAANPFTKEPFRVLKKS
jgi:hypothetical protein